MDKPAVFVTLVTLHITISHILLRNKCNKGYEYELATLQYWDNLKRENKRRDTTNITIITTNIKKNTIVSIQLPQVYSAAIEDKAQY